MSRDEYDNTNRGALWKNKNRETDKHPHYQGSIDVNGVEYWLSGWKVDSDNPKAPLLSLSVKVKEERDKYDTRSRRSSRRDDDDLDRPRRGRDRDDDDRDRNRRSAKEDLDDDIPF